jgi:hypothetical protein
MGDMRIKIDVKTMLDSMKEKFKEGLFLATALENYTYDGDEEAIKEIVDVLKIDFNDYVESAKEQGLWASKTKGEKNE